MKNSHISHHQAQKAKAQARKRGLKGTKPRSYKDLKKEQNKRAEEFEKALRQAKG